MNEHEQGGDNQFIETTTKSRREDLHDSDNKQNGSDDVDTHSYLHIADDHSSDRDEYEDDESSDDELDSRKDSLVQGSSFTM